MAKQKFFQNDVLYYQLMVAKFLRFVFERREVSYSLTLSWIFPRQFKSYQIRIDDIEKNCQTFKSYLERELN